MTVAFDVGPLRANPAGVGVYVRSLAQGLSEIGRDDLVYIGRRADADGLSETVQSMGRRGLPYPIWVELLGAQAVARAGASVAHFTDGLVPLVRRCPTIVSVMDLSLVRDWRSHRVVRYPRIPLVLAAPRLATRVIAISQATADEVIRLTGTPAKRIEVIPLAARTSARPASADVVDSLLGALRLTRGAYLLVPGTIEPRKNHVRVVAAFDSLVASGSIPPEMQLVIAGGRGWRSDRALAAVEASPSRGRIQLLGYVPENDMATLMTGAGAVVYASTYEGFGLPVLEAMACGAMVVTSSVSSMPEVAGDAGILVDPFDPLSIAAGIVEALGADDRDRARATKHAAGFSWRRTAEMTASLYDRLA